MNALHRHFVFFSKTAEPYRFPHHKLWELSILLSIVEELWAMKVYKHFPFLQTELASNRTRGVTWAEQLKAPLISGQIVLSFGRVEVRNSGCVRAWITYDVNTNISQQYHKGREVC